VLPGTPTPEWRHRFRTSWITPWDVDVSLTWRYYEGVTGLSGPNTPMPANRIDRELNSENYYDLSANWAVTEKADVTLGINNLLDDNPAISSSVGTSGNGNTFPQTYDALGRYVFLRARVAF
jgi:outer membrane receptor protein involved in Fe transport